MNSAEEVDEKEATKKWICHGDQDFTKNNGYFDYSAFVAQQNMHL